MKLFPLKFLIIFFLCLCLLPKMVDLASAHRVNVFARVEGETIYVESTFAGGRKIKAGRIVVTDKQGIELLSGLTDAKGKFAFQVPQNTELRIVVSAGQGHQGEWTIRADELQGMEPENRRGIDSKKTLISGKKNADCQSSVNPNVSTPESVFITEELEAIIDSALDRRLKPIIKMLAEQRQEGPNARDIFAGIGYILGLVGIAAYVHSRQKKE